MTWGKPCLKNNCVEALKLWELLFSIMYVGDGLGGGGFSCDSFDVSAKLVHKKKGANQLK